MPHMLSKAVAIAALMVLQVRGAGAQVPILSEKELADTVPGNDTSGVHRALRKHIGKFEDAWRKRWQDARNAGIDAPTDKARNPLVAAGRRGSSMSCYYIPSYRMLTLPSMHAIITNPDRGMVCPRWSPPANGVPADEGESIDFALPVADRQPIREERDQLIAELERAQVEHPFDAWIAGQRVRFVYDQREPDRTVATAKSCRGNTQVCTALLGLAFEQAGNLRAADSSYRVANAAETRETTDRNKCLSPDELAIFSTTDRLRLKREQCPRQRQLIEVMWWLADPLWSIPGNERFVAHGSRRISTTLHSVNNRDERYVWWKNAGGIALREMMIRYGWPSFTYWPGVRIQTAVANAMDPPATLLKTSSRKYNGYTEIEAISPNRGLNPIRIVTFPLTTKEYSPDRTALLPSTDAIFDPFSLNSAHWNLNPPDASKVDSWWPQEHMYIPYRLDSMPAGQDVLWRRDDSITYQLAIDDPLFGLDPSAKGPSKASLFGGTSATTSRQLAASTIAEGYTLRLKTEISSAPIVLSAEVLPRTNGEPALRNRFGVRPPPTLREMQPRDFALAQPVFLRMPNTAMPVPVDEESVLRYMAGGLQFNKAEPLGIYWESYGFTPGDTVQVELRIRRDDNVNVARKVGSVLGVASALRDSISIRWTEPNVAHEARTIPGARPVMARALGLDLSVLAPGTYVAIIEMRKGKNTPVRSERRFFVTEP